VWCAQSAAEQQALANYVATMKRHKHLRAPHRPYDTVVVQLARSTYRPAEPTPLDAPPTSTTAPAYGSGFYSSGQRPPPPSAPLTVRVGGVIVAGPGGGSPVPPSN
jgi:hypothetical protein